MTDTDSTESGNKLDLRQFLETVPPCIEKEVVSLGVRYTKRHGGFDHTFQLPEIELICKICDGHRRFRARHDKVITSYPDQDVVKSWEYWCKNCGVWRKLYSVPWGTAAMRVREIHRARRGQVPIQQPRRERLDPGLKLPAYRDNRDGNGNSPG